MTALTKDIHREYNPDKVVSAAPVASSFRLFKGAAVMRDTGGFLRPATTGAKFSVTNNRFAGFNHANEEDNTLGVDGAKTANFLGAGLVTIDVTGVVGESDVGAQVSADDDNGFTLTGTTPRMRIGKIVQWITGTTCRVKFEGVGYQSV